MLSPFRLVAMAVAWVAQALGSFSMLLILPAPSLSESQGRVARHIQRVEGAYELDLKVRD